MIAAARIRPYCLVTFGAPRVGNEAFGKRLTSVPVFRYVHGCDVVPRVPPGGIYQHFGTHIFLDQYEAAQTDPTMPQVWQRRIKSGIRYACQMPWFRSGQVALRSLVDHAIVNYTAAIAKEL